MRTNTQVWEGEGEREGRKGRKKEREGGRERQSMEGGGEGGKRWMDRMGGME